MATEEETKAIQNLLDVSGSPLDVESFGEVLRVSLYVLISKEFSASHSRLAFFTIDDSSIRKVVCFSSESLAKQWSPKQAIAVELRVAELLDALPDDCGILLNPAPLTSSDSQPLDISKSIALLQTNLDSSRDCKSDAKKQAIESSAEFEDLLIKDIVEVCESTSQIKEAYFLYRSKDLLSPVVVGVLCVGLHSEMRYHLIDKFAEISQNYFDSPSAIDVFDDLDVRNSRSWDLFKTLLPVYTQGH